MARGRLEVINAIIVIFVVNLGGTAFGQIAPNLRSFIDGTLAA